MTVSINGTSGLVFNDASTQNTAAKVGMVNRIINGDMRLDQRNAGASVTPTVTQLFSVDRWGTFVTQSSKVSFQQNAGSVTPPVGFINYLGATSLSAYSITSSDIFSIYQKVEGLNCADLAWGTANAQTVTLSFKVYSSLTGTFGGSLRNDAGNRSYPFSFTVNSANTWTTVSITIAGDTTGTWLTTNGTGINLSFGLGVGSTYTGTANAWAGANYISATGATSVVGTNGATFYITGVQLEKGSTATSFDYRPYGAELALCQRYFAKCSAVDGGSQFGGIAGITGIGNASGQVAVVGTYPVTMRTGPTISFTSTRLYDGVGTVAATTIAAYWASTTSFRADVSVVAATISRPYVMYGESASAFVNYSAEL